MMALHVHYNDGAWLDNKDFSTSHWLRDWYIELDSSSTLRINTIKIVTILIWIDLHYVSRSKSLLMMTEIRRCISYPSRPKSTSFLMLVELASAILTQILLLLLVFQQSTKATTLGYSITIHLVYAANQQNGTPVSPLTRHSSSSYVGGQQPAVNRSRSSIECH